MKYSRTLILAALMTVLVSFSQEVKAQCPPQCIVKINAANCPEVAFKLGTDDGFIKCVDDARKSPVECAVEACSYQNVRSQINNSFRM